MRSQTRGASHALSESSTSKLHSELFSPCMGGVNTGGGWGIAKLCRYSVKQICSWDTWCWFNSQWIVTQSSHTFVPNWI